MSCHNKNCEHHNSLQKHKGILNGICTRCSRFYQDRFMSKKGGLNQSEL